VPEAELALRHDRCVDTADAIWNRAALQRGGTNPQPGDVALSAVLRLHGLAMSGGLLDAIERLSDPDLDAAQDGYQWLDLNDASEGIRFVRSQIADGALDNDRRVDSLEQEADARYAAAVPQDETLVTAFTRCLQQRPEAFAST
jgi:hypothetical protein